MVNYFEGEFRISTLVWKLLPWCLWGIPSQGIFSRKLFCTRHIPGNFRSWLKVLVVLLTTRKLVQGKQLRNICFGRCGNLLGKGEDVILCRCRILLLQVCCQYLYFHSSDHPPKYSDKAPGVFEQFCYVAPGEEIFDEIPVFFALRNAVYRNKHLEKFVDFSEIVVEIWIFSVVRGVH